MDHGRVVAKPILPKICTGSRVAVTGAVTVVRPVLAGPPEWAKAKKGEVVIAVTETTNVVSAVEAMIRFYGKRTAAEGLCAPPKPPWLMASGRPTGAVGGTEAGERHRNYRHGS